MPNVSIEQLEQALIIDRHDLDGELERQPSTNHEVGNLLADAVSERDYEYERIKTVDAEEDVRLREEKVDAGEKFTEASIAAEVKLSEAHKRQHRKYLEAKKRVDRLTSLQTSFNQRSYAIRDLCELWISGYYTDASLKSSGRKAGSKRYEEGKERMSERRNSRRRFRGDSN